MDDKEWDIERVLNVGRRIQPYGDGMADFEVMHGIPGSSEMELSGHRVFDALEELTNGLGRPSGRRGNG